MSFVFPTLDACELILTEKMSRKRRDFDRCVERGIDVHLGTLASLERAEYIRDHLRASRAAIRELVDASREYRAALQAFANDGHPENYLRHEAAEARFHKALEGIK